MFIVRFNSAYKQEVKESVFEKRFTKLNVIKANLGDFK